MNQKYREHSFDRDEVRILTLDGFGQSLEHGQNTRLAYHGRVHLDERRRRHGNELLVVHSRNARVRSVIDLCEPLVKEVASRASGFHDMKCSAGGVVENSIDQDFEVGYTKSSRIDVFGHDAEGCHDDGAEPLRRNIELVRGEEGNTDTYIVAVATEIHEHGFGQLASIDLVSLSKVLICHRGRVNVWQHLHVFGSSSNNIGSTRHKVVEGRKHLWR